MPHPEVNHPWEDPRWFQVHSDGLVVQVDAPEAPGMYPATGRFATVRWPDDDD